MSNFQDYFSEAAETYAAYRPRYPAALFRWLAAAAPERGCAWDCGTGNGQAATALGDHFTFVVATDPSTSQLSHARQHARVQYAAMTAERCALRSGSAQLVTVAQALHWFDRAQFFREAERVLAPRGLIAVWMYGLLQVTPALDEILLRFHRDELGAFWPAERALVDTGYADVQLPFQEISAPKFEMAANWTLHELAGYLTSWSAVNRYRAARGTNPVISCVERLAPLWGDPAGKRPIRWPLTVKAGIAA